VQLFRLKGKKEFSDFSNYQSLKFILSKQVLLVVGNTLITSKTSSVDEC